MEQEGAYSSSQAAVKTSNDYDVCHFFFNNDFLDRCTEEQLDQTIIHEWVHVAMRSYDQAVAAVDEELSGGSRYHWNLRLEHERENLVERLAQQLWKLHYAGT
jgi:hypothetical protein